MVSGSSPAEAAAPEAAVSLMKLIKDPASLPFELAGEGLAAISSDRLTHHALLQAFSLQLAWQPELTGDQFRLNKKPLRPASVMIALIESLTHQGQLDLLLTRRSSTLREHSGQIAFPGGRVDESDQDDTSAALREAFEEIGLLPDNVRVLGHLSRYVTGTGFDIAPVVGIVEGSYEPVLSEAEVSEVFRVPLQFLMNPANHRRHRIEIAPTETTPGGQRSFYSMPYEVNGGSYFIWGATAAMLRNFYRMLQAADQHPLAKYSGESSSGSSR